MSLGAVTVGCGARVVIDVEPGGGAGGSGGAVLSCAWEPELLEFDGGVDGADQPTLVPDPNGDATIFFESLLTLHRASISSVWSSWPPPVSPVDAVSFPVLSYRGGPATEGGVALLIEKEASLGLILPSIEFELPIAARALGIVDGPDATVVAADLAGELRALRVTNAGEMVDLGAVGCAAAASDASAMRVDGDVVIAAGSELPALEPCGAETAPPGRIHVYRTGDDGGLLPTETEELPVPTSLSLQLVASTSGRNPWVVVNQAGPSGIRAYEVGGDVEIAPEATLPAIAEIGAARLANGLVVATSGGLVHLPMNGAPATEFPWPTDAPLATYLTGRPSIVVSADELALVVAWPSGLSPTRVVVGRLVCQMSS